jgi:hypothetical protein
MESPAIPGRFIVPEENRVRDSNREEKEDPPEIEPMEHQILRTRSRPQDGEAESEQHGEDCVELAFDEHELEELEHTVRSMGWERRLRRLGKVEVQGVRDHIGAHDSEERKAAHDVQELESLPRLRGRQFS